MEKLRSVPKYYVPGFPALSSFINAGPRALISQEVIESAREEMKDYVEHHRFATEGFKTFNIFGWELKIRNKP